MAQFSDKVLRGEERRMIPGEVIPKAGDIELNAGAAQVTIEVANTGDRPIQVGSHYHFFETNNALRFDRDKARGMRLDIAAGTAVRFEPGQTREVRLVPLSGKRDGLRLPAEDHGKALAWHRVSTSSDRASPTCCANCRRSAKTPRRWPWSASSRAAS